MTVLLDTDDLAEAEEVLGANYTKMQFRPASNRPTHTRAVRSPLGSMAFDELRYEYDFHYESDPMDGIGLCRVRSGAVAHEQPGAAVDMCQPGMAIAIAWREGVPFSGEVLDGHFDAVVVDRSLLDSVAATAPRLGTSEAVTLTAGMPTSSTANKLMAEAIGYVVHDVVTNPDAAQNPLVASAVAHHLAATMLAAFPNTALLEPTIEDRHDTTPILLRRAMAFIDDNAHRDITLADISNHIWVTPRSVQLMFRKHRDCTPMEYLRRVRLHHAHVELLQSNRMQTTVTQIAAKWGFAHMGRFAVYYREVYGRSPHVTFREPL
jgi:AraC-like DNA-binding protein